MHKPSWSPVSGEQPNQSPKTVVSGDTSAHLSKNLSHEGKSIHVSQPPTSAVQWISPISPVISTPVTEAIDTTSSVASAVIPQDNPPVNNTTSPTKPWFFWKIKNFFTKPFKKISWSSTNWSKPSLRQRAKSKVSSVFNRKSNQTPSTGTETMAVWNKNFEIHHGKWYNKILANTVGRLSGVLTHSLLTLKPWQWLQNPDVAKVKDILSRYSNVDRDADHTIYLGHTNRWDQIKKMFAKRKWFGNFIQNLWFVPMLILEGISANFSRADHYNPITKSITLYSPNEWIAAHELWHAEDFAQKWDLREYEKRLIPIYGTLLMEKNASRNAISRTKTDQEKKSAEKVLYPAFWSYIWGIFTLPFLFVARKLWRISNDKAANISWKISNYLKKFFTYIFPLPIIAWIGLWHINARLPKRWKWKIFDRPNDQTTGDTNQELTQSEQNVSLPDSQKNLNINSQSLSETAMKEELAKISAHSDDQIRENKKLQEEVSSLRDKLAAQENALKNAEKDVQSKKEEDKKNAEEKNNEPKEEVKENSFEKKATNLKSHIDTLIPQWYTTRIDTVGQYKRVVILDPSKKENPVKPTFYLTPTKDDMLNIHYTPLDSDGEVYYHGSLKVSDTKNIDACVSLVISAMQGEVTDMDAFTTNLAALGLEKKVTKKDEEPADVTKENTNKKKK